jgi:hypothetical protein
VYARKGILFIDYEIAGQFSQKQQLQSTLE